MQRDEQAPGSGNPLRGAIRRLLSFGTTRSGRMGQCLAGICLGSWLAIGIRGAISGHADHSLFSAVLWPLFCPLSIICAFATDRYSPLDHASAAAGLLVLALGLLGAVKHRPLRLAVAFFLLNQTTLQYVTEAMSI